MASNIITSDGKDLDERYMPKGTHIPANPNAYLVSSWRSGSNWWRKWSDGFIEQGGGLVSRPATGNSVQNQTVSLHTPFSSSTYVAVATLHGQGGGFALGVSKSNNHFTIHSEQSASKYDRNWYACGF